MINVSADEKRSVVLHCHRSGKYELTETVYSSEDCTSIIRLGGEYDNYPSSHPVNQAGNLCYDTYKGIVWESTPTWALKVSICRQYGSTWAAWGDVPAEFNEKKRGEEVTWRWEDVEKEDPMPVDGVDEDDRDEA